MTQEKKHSELPWNIHSDWGDTCGISNINEKNVCSLLDKEEDEFDMWNELGVPCGGYSGKIDFLVIEIMKSLQMPTTLYMTDIAKKLEVSEEFVELVQYILCSKDLFEYGVSPRGCFPTSDDQVKDFIKKCEAYYKKRCEQ